MVTSFLNDSNYAYSAMRDLLGAARAYYIETEDAMAEVERILALEDEELSAMVLTAMTKVMRSNRDEPRSLSQIR